VDRQYDSNGMKSMTCIGTLLFNIVCLLCVLSIIDRSFIARVSFVNVGGWCMVCCLLLVVW